MGVPSVYPRPLKVTICFAGVDGSGKSTHAKALCQALQAKCFRCVYVRPRYLLLDIVKKHIPWASGYFLSRYVSITVSYKMSNSYTKVSTPLDIVAYLARIMYVLLTYFLVIHPLTLRNDVVVCDRYFFDWFYDSKGRNLHMLRILPSPDLLIVLDLPPKCARSRVTQFEDKGIPIETYLLLKTWYKKLTTYYPSVIIDTTETFEVVHEKVLEYVTAFLSEPR